MFHWLRSAVTGVGMLVAGTMMISQPASALELKMASGYPDNNYLTEALREFIDDVQATTKGEVTITLHNNQSLVKLENIPNAVRQRQVAFGQVYLANLGNQNHMMTLDAIPFLASDTESALKLLDAQKAYLDAWFAERGMRVLFAQFFPAQGFYATKPINSMADLNGLKLRIHSDITKRMAELLGARPLLVQFGEIPQAFATGLVNAMFTSPSTGVDVQAWDFTTHYTLAGVQRTKLLVAVNESVFKQLSEADQQAILAASEKAQKRSLELGDKATTEQLERLKKNGIAVTEASAEFEKELRVIGDQMVGEWREAADEDQRAVLDAYLKSRNETAGKN